MNTFAQESSGLPETWTTGNAWPMPSLSNVEPAAHPLPVVISVSGSDRQQRKIFWCSNEAEPTESGISE